MNIHFETTECGRCGGNGRYSFNQMHGDTCYGCNGGGKVFTAAGKRARKRYTALVEKASTISPFLVRPGDAIKTTVGAGPARWRFIEEVALDFLDGCRGVSMTFTVNGTVHGNRSGQFTVQRHPGSARLREIMTKVASRKGAEVSE